MGGTDKPGTQMHAATNRDSTEESTPLLDYDTANEVPHWPRNRELGWLIPNGMKYPPPVLPSPLRGLQADLDSAWMELERQHVIVNRVNLLTSSLALLITSSGGLTTAMASSKNGRIWATIMGTLTTVSGTVMGGIRAIGQPRRAEDRVRRLERIIDQIARLYYSSGATGQGEAQKKVIDTWRLIDNEEAQTEREERRAGHFGYSTTSAPNLDGPSSSPLDASPPAAGAIESPALTEADLAEHNRARTGKATYSRLLGRNNAVRTRTT